MDDTPTRERIRLQHRGANTNKGLGPGSFIEMQSTGDVIHKVYGDNYTIVAGNNYIIIGTAQSSSGAINNGQQLNITVNGDAYFDVKGDRIEKVEGNYELHVKGDYNVTIEGNADISSVGNMDIGANPIFGGQMSITAGDSLVVDSDLSVTGEMTAAKITSPGRIDSGSGISAGPLGFVSVLGGLSIGVPVAAPETIICAGDINALGAMNSPLGNFGIMSSIWSYDVVNLAIFNSHTHIASGFGSPTTPPVPQEIGA
jgi:hypothetical protein